MCDKFWSILCVGLSFLLIIAGCAKIPCYGPAHFAPPANADYTAEEVRLPTAAGFIIAGTLTLPANSTPPFPAVLLITGSSPQNRDMMGHWAWPASAYKPFRQIADALSRNGLAVLRTDDRGCGCSGGGPLLEAPISERVDDNRAALDYLRSRPEIDSSRIALLGLSEGGSIGPIIAASDHSIRALVIMAGCATNGWKIMEHQFRYDIERDETLIEREKQEALDRRMRALRRSVKAGETNPWFESFLAYKPLPTAKKVSCPVLILQGEKDAHVPAQHARYLAQAMRSGGNRDVTVVFFPDTNHLFLPDSDGRRSGYKKLLRNGAVISDKVLEVIVGWLTDHLLVGTRLTLSENCE